MREKREHRSVTSLAEVFTIYQWLKQGCGSAFVFCGSFSNYGFLIADPDLAWQNRGMTFLNFGNNYCTLCRVCCDWPQSIGFHLLFLIWFNKSTIINHFHAFFNFSLLDPDLHSKISDLDPGRKMNAYPQDFCEVKKLFNFFDAAMFAILFAQLLIRGV